MMPPKWEKIISNLAYKAPEVQTEYLLSELHHYVRAYGRQAEHIDKLNGRIADLEEKLQAVADWQQFVTG